LHVKNIVKRISEFPACESHGYNLFIIIPGKFQYGLLVWGGLNENAVRPLILFQRKIVRICLGRNNLIGPTGENFKLLNVLPVESVYK